MKVALASFLVVPMAAVTPFDVATAIATTILTLGGSGFLAVIGWRLFGQTAWGAITSFFDRIEGVDAKLGDLVGHAKAVDERLARHDGILEEHGRQLSYLRGKEDARREIAATAGSVAQIVHDVTKDKEEHKE